MSIRQRHPAALDSVVRHSAGRQGQTIGPHAEAIVAEVAAKTGVTVEQLKSDDRHKHIARPRQAAYYALYETGRYSLPTIGEYFGGRDHTTVLYGIRAHEARGGGA